MTPLALRARGWLLETMDDRYGPATSQRLSDEQWIADAAGQDDILLTKDPSMAGEALPARAIWVHEARVFALDSAQLTSHQMTQRFRDWEDQIRRTASSGRRGYLMKVSAAGLRNVRLLAP